MRTSSNRLGGILAFFGAVVFGAWVHAEATASLRSLTHAELIRIVGGDKDYVCDTNRSQACGATSTGNCTSQTAETNCVKAECFRCADGTESKLRQCTYQEGSTCTPNGGNGVCGNKSSANCTWNGINSSCNCPTTLDNTQDPCPYKDCQ